MALLVNLKGRLVEVEGQAQIEKRIEEGFRLADENEKEAYYLEREIIPPAQKGEGIFFRRNPERPHGYGESTKPLVKALSKAGIPISHEYTGQDIGMVYAYPHPLASLETNKKVLYTMFESTSIDPEWVPYLNMADRIFVPSHFCQDAFATRGVKTEVIPLGYNPASFYYKEKEDDGIFTFSMYNAFDMRKGWDILFGAFTEEFKQQKDVKLILKTVAKKLPFPILRSEYPNVEIINESVGQNKLRELLYKTDCFVFPSRGEGFGLTPLEALACGTTSIIPNASGMSEYFNDKYFIELEIEGLRAAIYEHFDINVVGKMVEPSKKDLRKKMRWAYENREKCWQMGREGAKWVKDNYTIQRTGVTLANKLRSIGKIHTEERKDVFISNPKRGKKSVAFFLFNRNIYSGGRIFCYQIIHALCGLGYDVTIYTNQRPVFEKDLQWCNEYKTVIVDRVEDCVVDADIYMGAVKEGNIACARNAARSGNPAYCFVFDPISMIEEYDGERLDHEKDWYFEVDNLIKASPDINVVFLTEVAREKCENYYPNKKFVLQPCVNEKIAKKYKGKNKREDIIVISATSGERNKGFERSLKAFSLTPSNWKYHIFTSSYNSHLPELIKRYNLEDRVVIHYDEGDESKFEIMSKAKVLLCASPYEGYGMWLAEARYMGLTCVVEENGIFKEVFGDDNSVLMAERNNDLDLISKLNEAIHVKRYESRVKGFEFEDLVSNLRKLLQ